METTYGHHIGPVTGDITGNLNGVKALKFTAAFTPAEVAANTTAEQDVTVTGVAVGDVIFVNKPTAQAGLGIVGVRVKSTDTVSVTFSNNTATPITPTASQTYAFGVLR